jgi:hypothetical protein
MYVSKSTERFDHMPEMFQYIDIHKKKDQLFDLKHRQLTKCKQTRHINY